MNSVNRHDQHNKVSQEMGGVTPGSSLGDLATPCGGDQEKQFQNEVLSLVEEAQTAQAQGRYETSLEKFESLHGLLQGRMRGRAPHVEVLCEFYLSTSYYQMERYQDAMRHAQAGLTLTQQEVGIPLVISSAQFMARLAVTSFVAGYPRNSEMYLGILQREPELSVVAQREDVLDHLLTLQELCIVSLHPGLALRAGECCVSFLGDPLQIDPLLRMRILTNRTESLQWLGRHDEALRTAHEQLQLATTFPHFSVERLVHSESLIVGVLSDMGSHTEAYKRLCSAAKIVESDGVHISAVAQLEAQMVEQLFEAGRCKEGIDLAKEALRKVYSRMPGPLRVDLSVQSDEEIDTIARQVALLSLEEQKMARECLEALLRIEEERASICALASDSDMFEKTAAKIAVYSKLLTLPDTQILAEQVLRGEVGDSFDEMQRFNARLHADLGELPRDSFAALMTRIQVAQVALLEGNSESAREQVSKVDAILARVPMRKSAPSVTLLVLALAALHAELGNTEQSLLLLESEVVKYEVPQRRLSLRRVPVLQSLAAQLYDRDPERAHALEEEAARIKAKAFEKR